MSEKYYARLKVLSETLSPEEITKCVGIESDRSWQIGDLRPKTIIREKNNGWIIQSTLGPETPLEVQIDDVLGRVECAASRIQEISSQATVEFSCVAYCEQSPALFFDKAIISRLNALGASL